MINVPDSTLPGYGGAVKMLQPLVSVIVPVYNGQQFIADAIESILAQTYKNLEIIVVNDGSTDSSELALTPYINRIKYIFQNNKGIAGAYNTGIKYCSGHYVCFLEQDDVWLHHKTEEQLDYLVANPNTGMVYSRYIVNDCTSNKLHDHSLSMMELQGRCFGELFSRILEGPSIITFSSVMIPKRVLDKVGPLDEKLHISVDYDLWLKIAFLYEIGFISAPALQYRLHDSNTSSNSLAALEDDCYILEGWRNNKKIYEVLQADVVRERLLDIYTRLAAICRRERKGDCERAYIRKMLKMDPFAASLWNRYFMTYLGEKRRRYLEWYLLKIKRLMMMWSDRAGH